MPPAFVRASSVAEQEAYKRQEQNNQKLCEESEQGNLEVVDQLLKQGAEPDAYKNERGYTALIAACANGDTGHADSDGRDHFQVVERLLEGGAELDQTTKSGFTPLIGNGATPLIYAADSGNLGIVNSLLKAGAKIDEQSSTENTALICAAVRGHTAVANRLIEGKASVDIAGEGGASAMMKAAYNGRADIVQALIAAGASINMKSKSGDTALVWTRKNGRQNCEEILLAHGAISRASSAGSYGRISRVQSNASTSSASNK